MEYLALDYGYDFDFRTDLRWNYDGTEATLTLPATYYGDAVEITFLATAEEWAEVKRMFEDDPDAVDDWMDRHTVEVHALFE